MAALQLFSEQGYDETTVAVIADRVGLTKSTFHRHFPDKRDVLGAGQETLSRDWPHPARRRRSMRWLRGCLSSLSAINGLVGGGVACPDWGTENAAEGMIRPQLAWGSQPWRSCAAPCA